MTTQTLPPLDVEHILTGQPLDWASPSRPSDQEIRSLKQEGSPQIRVSASEPVPEQDRVVRFVASDETPDRVGDIISVAGWNLTSYKANPVVLWGHDSSDRPPIGRSVNVRRGMGPSGKPALLASIEFAPKEANPFAETVYQLTKGGYLNAVSVGFMPRATKELTAEERQSLGMPNYGMFYTSADLLEISVVSVPANPSALITGAKSLVHSGLLQDREVESFLKNHPMTEEELSKRLKAKIRGFVDLGALSETRSADDGAEAEEAPAPVEDAPEDAAPEQPAAEAEAPEEGGEAEATTEASDELKAFLGTAHKHIADVEETEGTWMITFLKPEMLAGYDDDDDEVRREDEDDEEYAALFGRSAAYVESLMRAQADQTKALTTLVDSISDLTKRIRSMSETSGEAAASDVAPSDAQGEAQKEKAAHIERMTNDFLNRLNTLK